MSSHYPQYNQYQAYQRLPYQPYPYYDPALQPPVSVSHQYTAHTAFPAGPASASLLPVEHVAKVSAWRWPAPPCPVQRPDLTR